MVNNQEKIKLLDEVKDLYDKIQQIREDAKNNAPYRFNAVLNATPLEPGVSKILAGFFWQKTNGEYKVLQSFVRTFFGNELAELISTPTILAEEIVKDDKRIDILIYEKGKYAIVLENKIWDAQDQPNQLANYIEAMSEGEYHFEKKQIYVAYLPKTKDHHPSPNSWLSQDGGYSYQIDFQDRYQHIDFKEKILHWLNTSEEIRTIDDEYFRHSLFLFIDFLNRKLKIDKIDDMAQTEIEKLINIRYHLGDNVFENSDILSQKLNEIGEVVNQLATIRKELTKQSMREWLNHIQKDYQRYSIVDCIENQQYIHVGILLQYKDCPDAIEVILWNNANYLCVAIAPTSEGKNYKDEMLLSLRDYIHQKGGFKRGKEWLYYKGTSYEQGYFLFKEIVDFLCSIEL